MKKIIKKKLRDLTLEDYERITNEKCDLPCSNCPFTNVICGIDSSKCWINHKELYSDEFLNQEIEIVLSLSVDEHIILKNLGNEWKYIARDEYGVLYLFTGKPKKEIDNVLGEWVEGYEEMYSRIFPFSHLFEFIQWEDEEPCLIEDLLKE